MALAAQALHRGAVVSYPNAIFKCSVCRRKEYYCDLVLGGDPAHAGGTMPAWRKCGNPDCGNDDGYTTFLPEGCVVMKWEQDWTPQLELHQRRFDVSDMAVLRAKEVEVSAVDREVCDRIDAEVNAGSAIIVEAESDAD